MKLQPKSTPFNCLPDLELIKTYPKENWLCIGHLTHAKGTSAETQLLHFRELMQQLGWPNRVFGRRLHWLARVGGASDHIHLHFLLGRHQLTDGHRHSYTATEVVSFLKNNWKTHGMGKIEIYDSSRPGVEYVLRREADTCENHVEMSEGLVAVLKKGIKDQRDPLISELVAMLRSEGVNAGFGDEIENLRRGAA